MNVRQQQRMLNIAKIVIILLILLFIVHVYASTDRRSDTSIEAMQKAVLQDKEPEGMLETDGLGFRQVYGIDASEFDGVIYYRPESNMDASELLIAKTESSATAETLLDAVETRISSQKTVFEDYAPEQYGLLKDAIAVKKGNYVFLAVSEKADQYYNAFLKAL